MVSKNDKHNSNSRKNLRSKKRDAKELKKKYEESSDSSSDEEEVDYEDSISDNEIEEELSKNKLDKKEYRKFLAKLFPSKYSKNKAKNNKNKKNKNKKKIVESESESDNEHEESGSDEEADEEIINKSKKGVQKFNLIFTIGGPKGKSKNYVIEDDDEEEWDEEWDEEDDEDWEEEDSEEDSDEDYEEEYDEEDDEEDEEDDDEEEDEEDDEEDEEDEDCKKKKKSTSSKKEKNNIKFTEMEIEENKKMLEELKNNNKNNYVTKELIKVCEDKIKDLQKNLDKKLQKKKTANVSSFRSKMQNKNIMNDYEFFKKMSINEQENILKELDEINKICKVEKPYRLTVLEKEIPYEYKACALKKLNMLRFMEPGGGEFYKIKNWIDTFMSIPFDTYKHLPVSMSDGTEKCQEFMENAKSILDSSVYGLNDAKMQIMQMIGQWITNPSAVGSAIAIQGPMGTGKTTLVKEGISKILGRDFAFIALGGATDSSFLEGHSYTYEGSTWGQIVSILIKSKCMNPVIYFGELDKISDTPKGEEITGILTHLTDTSQNNEFQDKYFSEIKLDLSKCLFIFSYNDESKVNPILKDRMYRIHTKGYDLKDKLSICNNYLLPNIRKQILFESEDIIIEDDVVQYIVDNYTDKEFGVRNLKRCLEIIHTKLNLYRLMKPGSSLFDNTTTIEVSFPKFKLTREIVDKLIKKTDDTMRNILNALYI